jgi:hypothetical protein
MSLNYGKEKPTSFLNINRFNSDQPQIEDYL